MIYKSSQFSQPHIFVLFLYSFQFFQNCNRDSCCDGGYCLKTCYKTGHCKDSDQKCFEGFCRPRCEEDYDCEGKVLYTAFVKKLHFLMVL